MMEIRFKIPNDEDMRTMCLILVIAGYKVWTENKDTIYGKKEHFVCAEVDDKTVRTTQEN